MNVNFYFGGTSLLIVVGVAMDTINQIEAQLVMRHYEGFTPRLGKIRGAARRRSFLLVFLGASVLAEMVCESHRSVRLAGVREAHRRRC